MIYEIRKYPDPILKQMAQPVTEFGEPLMALIADMFETMYARNGVGLAAPQIGISRQLCVIDPNAGKEDEPARTIVLINPRIIERSGEVRCEEGCLSVPGYYAEVQRSAHIIIHSDTPDGGEMELVATDFLAIICQHEMDHLTGNLFLDRIGSVERDLIKRKIKKAVREGNYA